MTDHASFQPLQRLKEADVAQVSVDDLERLRSEMREEMMSEGHSARQEASASSMRCRPSSRTE
jgi:hypothetical protein